MSINLAFDAEGLVQLLEGFEKAILGSTEKIDISLDNSVLSLKKHGTAKPAKLGIKLGDQSILYKDKENVYFQLDKEDLEICVTRFKECKTINYFFPAELIRIQVPKNKMLDYIFCKFYPDNQLNPQAKPAS